MNTQWEMHRSLIRYWNIIDNILIMTSMTWKPQQLSHQTLLLSFQSTLIIFIHPLLYLYSICSLLFNSSKLSTLHAVKASANMFMSLAGSLTHLFSQDKLLRFIVTVSKNYRPVAYHNWSHGFCVAQTMFAVLQSSTGHFSELEVLKPVWCKSIVYVIVYYYFHCSMH